MSDRDAWRPWLWEPPDPKEWAVVEWITSYSTEPNVGRVEDLLHPRNAEWNIADVSWRPVS